MECHYADLQIKLEGEEDSFYVFVGRKKVGHVQQVDCDGTEFWATNAMRLDGSISTDIKLAVAFRDKRLAVEAVLILLGYTKGPPNEPYFWDPKMDRFAQIFDKI